MFEAVRAPVFQCCQITGSIWDYFTVSFILSVTVSNIISQATWVNLNFTSVSSFLWLSIRGLASVLTHQFDILFSPYPWILNTVYIKCFGFFRPQTPIYFLDPPVSSHFEGERFGTPFPSFPLNIADDVRKRSSSVYTVGCAGGARVRGCHYVVPIVIVLRDEHCHQWTYGRI